MTRQPGQPCPIEPSDPVQDIAHLGNIELLTPRIDLTTAYFRDLLGMEVVHAAGPSVFLRGYGDYAASTLKLTAAPRPGIGCISWRTTSPAALDRRVNAIEAAGRAGRWIDPECGRGPSFRFRDPDGHVMAIYYEEAPYRAPEHLRSTLKNLPMRYTGRGVNVRRIDHVALLSRDVAADRRFMEEVLGFRLREQVRFDRGAVEIGSWLSPSILHHQVAYVVDTRRVGGRLHHIALWVDNREDVLRAADIYSEHGVFIEAGPAKHNNSQGFYLYAYEPGGNRIELYTGSFLVLAPDWRPVIWDEAERGTGVYWGGALPESFLSYATPDAAAAAPVDAARVPVFDPS